MALVRSITALLLVLAASVAQGADERSKAVDRLMQPYTAPGSPGCAVAVVENGQVVHSGAYGLASIEHDVPLTISSVFAISSTTKQFTGFAVQLLKIRRQLALTDSIRKYVPQLPPSFERITLDHLLHHTSGIPQLSGLNFLGGGRSSLPPPEDLIAALTRLGSLNFEPGREYGYSNEDYTLLGLAVSKASGMSLAEFARREIFGPLHMDSTRYVDNAAPIIKHRATNYARKSDGSFELSSEEWWGNPKGTSDRFPDGGYTVISTVEDFLKWDRNFMDATVGGRAVIDAMQESGTLDTGEPVGYGSGLVIGTTRGVRSVGHTGEGHGNRSIYRRFPDQHLSVIALCNLDNLSVAPPDRIYDIYLGEETKAPVAPRPSPPVPSAIILTTDQRRPLAGTYWNASRRTFAQVELTASGLRIKAEAGESLWFPVSDDEFRREGNPQGQLVFRGDQIIAPPGFQRVELASPNVASLSEYAGEWYSSDLDVTYRLAVKDGRLHWSWPVNETGYDLTPFIRDQFHFCTETSAFRCSGTDFAFTRDSEGRVAGLSVSLARARNIRFQRVSSTLRTP